MSSPPSDVRVEESARSALGDAAALLGREMIDNPVHVAALGADRRKRERALSTLFGTALGESAVRPLTARRGAVLTGVLVLQPPGACPPSAAQQMRMGSRLMLRLGPATLSRVGAWMGEWQRRDVKEPHWHLGPLAVLAAERNRGIGSLLLEAACARVDESGAPAALQTDSEASLPLLGRFGFAVEQEVPVFGVSTWLLVRRPS